MAAKKEKYEVIQDFRDKDTQKLYLTGSEYETDSKERADFLKERGYLADMPGEDAAEPATGKKSDKKEE
ncbi:hypothetical protein [Paenibacillus sp. OAE614]|uniref:hypothetical protein n=1 Tax=Paenibacillus sp. OAE614 TaxID=2663804 RepID=UPI00178A51D6